MSWNFFVDDADQDISRTVFIKYYRDNISDFRNLPNMPDSFFHAKKCKVWYPNFHKTLWSPNLNSMYIFFSSRVFFHRHWRFNGQQGKGGNHLYSFLTLPPGHEHSEFSNFYVRIYLYVTIVSLIALLIITRLLPWWGLPPWTIHLIDWWCWRRNVNFSLLDNLTLDFDTAIWKVVDLESCLPSP